MSGKTRAANRKGYGGFVRLLTGSSGHWITVMFRPDAANRELVPTAIDYVLWKASRHSNKPVYCGIREYQSEVGNLLEERGFHLLSNQALLGKIPRGADQGKTTRPCPIPGTYRRVGGDEIGTGNKCSDRRF